MKIEAAKKIRVGAVLVLLTALQNGWSQSATGQITGSVTDASGALIAGVSITLNSSATGLTRTTKTNESGTFSFPQLPVGVYSVVGEQPGFSIAKRSDIQLNVDQIARVDLTLSVGATTETVNVVAATVSIDTESAEVGQVVSQKQVG